jgi:hypothetical protein
VRGLIEGIADAVSSFTKMAAGYIADKLGHRKALVMLGYALTPLGQALMALAFALHGGYLVALGAIFFLASFYVAVREALEASATADMVPAATLSLSYGARRTVTDTAKFVSSTASSSGHSSRPCSVSASPRYSWPPAPEH